MVGDMVWLVVSVLTDASPTACVHAGMGLARHQLHLQRAGATAVLQQQAVTAGAAVLLHQLPQKVGAATQQQHPQQRVMAGVQAPAQQQQQQSPQPPRLQLGTAGVLLQPSLLLLTAGAQALPQQLPHSQLQVTAGVHPAKQQTAGALLLPHLPPARQQRRLQTAGVRPTALHLLLQQQETAGVPAAAQQHQQHQQQVSPTSGCNGACDRMA